MSDTPEAAAREVAMELAQTIADHATFYCLHCGQYDDDCKCEKPVQDRARDNIAEVFTKALLSFRSIGRAEGLEEAAKVADEWAPHAISPGTARNIRDAIRALAGSTKEGE